MILFMNLTDHAMLDLKKWWEVKLFVYGSLDLCVVEVWLLLMEVGMIV